MKYIKDLREGETVREVLLCKKKEVGKNSKTGDEYFALLLGDKTGTVDGKVWTTTSPGIGEFESGDYIYIEGQTKSFNSRLQIHINRIHKASDNEYDPADFLPVSKKNINGMYNELVTIIKTVQNPYLRQLLDNVYVKDSATAKAFSEHTAAKTIHHAFKGGLLEHSLSVTKLCINFAEVYPVLNRDLLVTAAMLHDIGKLLELSELPDVDYTDEGQLLGHIFMGAEFVSREAGRIEGFPQKLKAELVHCILAHHGELEYGSPKKPAIVEALALSMADNLDAKMETLTELFDNASDDGWLGFQKSMDSNVRKTGK